MGMRADFREMTRKTYSGYCCYVREEGLEPIPYYAFTDIYWEYQDLTRKQRKAALIEVTKHYWRNVK